MTDIKAGTLHVDLAGDTSDLKKSLQDAEKDLKGFDSKVSESVMSLGEMKREFRTLSKMSLVGKSPEEIEKATKRMAFLKDAIGDTNATIKSLSLDPFQKFAETVQVGSTFMAGMAGATSLFGGEQEKMNELMQKTVALIAIANAAQEASTFLEERSAGIWIKNKTVQIAARIKEALTINTVTVASTTENAVKSKGNIITQAITKAQLLWNAAVAANPIGLLIAGVLALGAGIGFLTYKLLKNNEQYKEAANAIATMNAQIEATNSFYGLQTEILNTLGASQDAKNLQRIKQIDDQKKSIEGLISKYEILATETNFWGNETDQAKAAKEKLKELNDELIKLGDERIILGLQNIQNEKKRAEEIEEFNTKLRIALLYDKEKEVAELNEQYKKDVKNYGESTLLKQKYAKDLREIELKYSKIDNQAMIDWGKSLNEDKLKRDAKFQIPEQKITVPVKIDLKPEVQKMSNLIDISNEIGASVTAGLNDIVSGISETIGKMIAGSGNMDDVFQDMLEIIANFMSSLGKSLIAAGIGAIAFDTLLETPAAAIAAGAALVALSAAVKQKLADGPTGNGSSYSSANINKGSSSNYTGIRDLRSDGTINVNVKGVLVGKGSDLYGVLEKESNRRAL